MTDEKELTLDDMKYAIMVLTPDCKRCFSVAFFNSCISEQDFFDTRMKLTQSRGNGDFVLVCAAPEEVIRAKELYTKDKHNYQIQNIPDIRENYGTKQ